MEVSAEGWARKKEAQPPCRPNQCIASVTAPSTAVRGPPWPPPLDNGHKHGLGDDRASTGLCAHKVLMRVYGPDKYRQRRAQ